MCAWCGWATRWGLSRFESGTLFALTASTETIQRFVARYVAEASAGEWEAVELRRVR
jgi:hypothetical protein